MNSACFPTDQLSVEVPRAWPKDRTGQSSSRSWCLGCFARRCSRAQAAARAVALALPAAWAVRLDLAIDASLLPLY